MELVAVDLDHQTAIEPRGVDLVALHGEVDCRAGEAGGVADLDESALEVRAEHRGHGTVLANRLLQRPHAASAVAALAELIDRAEIEQAEPLCLVDGACRLTRRHDLGEVQQRAGKGRDPECC